MQKMKAKAEIGQVMDLFPYGLYIVGSEKDGEPNGMMADWVMQAAFEPRLLVVSLENDSHTLENVRAKPFFTVNLLAEDHESMELAARFAQPYFGSKVRGRGGWAKSEIHHKLDGVSYESTDHDCPVVSLAVAWLECKARSFVEAGDHTLVVGEVIDGALVRSADVLTSTYTGWSYSG